MAGVVQGNSFDADLPPMRAAVIPRLRRPQGEASVPLDQLVARFGGSVKKGLVVLAAKAGGGKTTALRHLRAMLPAQSALKIFDATEFNAAMNAAATHVAVVASESVNPRWPVLDVLEICPWSIDDHVEYLAKMHRGQCADVLRRLKRDDFLVELDGSPQLLTLVMDRMAADPGLGDSYEALRQLVPVFFDLDDAATEDLVRSVVARAMTPAGEFDLSPEQQRWWRHRAFRQVMATEWIVRQLEKCRRPELLKSMGGRDLLPHIVRAVREDRAAIETLSRWVDEDPLDFGVPMAVSILAAADVHWRPRAAKGLYLGGASLRSVRWAGVDLTGAVLMGADFSKADLSGAILANAAAQNAVFSHANLRETQLTNAMLMEAALDSADLSGAQAGKVNLKRAVLENAILTSADLAGADLSEADLNGSCFLHANLQRAKLIRTRVEDADFSGANLERAQLLGVQMGAATWAGALFRNASLHECDLEWLELPNADFSGADLTGSLLTGSCITGGNFQRAILRQTGLAEIDWEGCDLQGADFSEASFHMGSSRSGLVGSTIPCEGSRTGFYTDEFNEQDYKAPEEIRKASLCRANLCGAMIEKTDFYLVDLRRARYTAPQREWFQRCGAILVSRVQ